MYWRSETAAAWRMFWERVRAASTVDVPDLTAPEDLPDDWTDHWTDPDLFLSMTCGFPYRTVLSDQVAYVGTLDFGLGDMPGHYHSVVVAREGFDLQAPARLAINGRDSQSGWACIRDPDPRNPRPDITAIVETGAHAGSVRAVAEGRADLAYVDAVTWRLLERHEPLAQKVLPCGRTGPTPGLPLVTARAVDPGALRLALIAACADLPADLSETLGGLTGVTILGGAAYLAVPDLSPRTVPLP